LHRRRGSSSINRVESLNWSKLKGAKRNRCAPGEAVKNVRRGRGSWSGQTNNHFAGTEKKNLRRKP